MEHEKAMGTEDQELLLKAFVNYLSKKINRSDSILKGMIRQAINESVVRHNTTLKEMKHFDEKERLRIFIEMVDIFLEKVKHLVESKFQRDNLKSEAIKIYEHWKKTKRINSSKSLLDEMEEIANEA